MGKNAIWGVIGLMSVALIGIIALQTYWINQRVGLEEKHFDNTIFSVLNNVSQKLEEREDARLQETFEHLTALSKDNVNSDDYALLETMGIDVGHLFNKKGQINNHSASSTLECNCSVCQKKRTWIKEKDVLKSILDFGTMSERINPERLERSIQKELASNNIKLECQSGVYASEKKKFIIKNGSYTVDMNFFNEGSSSAAGVSIPEIEGALEGVSLDKKLLNSRYSVQLFSYGETNPGALHLYFPGKTRYVWNSVLATVIAAILFTGIILFCFIYTIQVILAQKKLSKIKSDFINNMTHEFKTPIATISLASDSMTNPMIINNPDKVQRFAKIIKQENQRMNKQVERVLQIALVDKRDFQLKITEIDAHEIVAQAVNNVNLRAESKGGKAEMYLNASKFILKADATHFSNVVNNLLDNAIKYTPEKPHIIVHTENKNNGIIIRVKDNGIGMTKEDIRHIFDKFFRVHTGNLHDVKGFGLGLSYVKAITDAHHGKVSVKSEVGKGSEFSLFFPLNPKI